MQVFRIFVGALRENCYIVSNAKNNTLVVDPGTEADLIFNKLVQNNLTLKTILLTHGHYDHIGAINELTAKTNCKTIYVGKEDIELLTDNEKSMAATVNQDAVFLEDKILKIAEGTFKLEDLDVEVIKTPGHTKGSVCYLINGILFSGDTLFRNGIGRTDFWGGNRAELEKSLKKLSKLPKDIIVCPGHGLKTRIGDEL
ncbi:MAG: MBL fold metallo-hydrolase [Oscillospiraceae bacterium]|nr:MBL fold metallo-hydrolase [Oscillospiraceae bacterium]